MTASSTRQLPSVAGRLAQRDHLGVGGGVGADLALVVAGGDDLAVLDDHGADRDVIVVERAHRLAQREAHEVLVARKEARAHRSGNRRYRCGQGNFGRLIMSLIGLSRRSGCELARPLNPLTSISSVDSAAVPLACALALAAAAATPRAARAADYVPGQVVVGTTPGSVPICDRRRRQSEGDDGGRLERSRPADARAEPPAGRERDGRRRSPAPPARCLVRGAQLRRPCRRAGLDPQRSRPRRTTAAAGSDCSGTSSRRRRERARGVGQPAGRPSCRAAAA